MHIYIHRMALDTQEIIGDVDIENSRSIAELRAWILNHLSDNLSLQGLSQHVSMSASKLQCLRDSEEELMNDE